MRVFSLVGVFPLPGRHAGGGGRGAGLWGAQNTDILETSIGFFQGPEELSFRPPNYQRKPLWASMRRRKRKRIKPVIDRVAPT